MLSGSTWQDNNAKWSSALLEAIAEAAKASFLNESIATTKAVQDRLQSIQPSSQQGTWKSAEEIVKAPVPGVVAVVYEDFFSKASAVAVQLLKVHLYGPCPTDVPL